jgi:3-phenylpropionate/trans-cinnamate dioxygenase ferredoxin reductase subunit
MGRYMIVGGGLAGGRACQGIRKVDTEGNVTVIAGEKHLPYQRPPLSKGYLTGKQGLDRVYIKDDAFYADNHIDLVQGVRATQVDRAAHRVLLEDGRVLPYDKLLLATGGYAWRLPIPGNDLPGVYTLRTIGDSDAIRQAAQPGGQALVLGGSFIGAEVAASLTQLGTKVTMVFPETRLLQAVTPEALSAHLQAQYQGRGVQILTGVKPLSIEGSGKAERVRLDNGQTVHADMVVMGVGIRLHTELARDAGLELADRGAVVVDEFLRTSDPDIYAAGDVAAWPDPTFGKRMRVEHWDVAWRQGLRVGYNMAGQPKPYTTLPYFFSDLFDLSFEAWGDLSAWDWVVQRGSLETGGFTFFYFAQGRMVGVLTANRSESERAAMEPLVRARLAYDRVAAQLGDERADLTALVS